MDADAADLEILHDACEEGDLETVKTMHSDPEAPGLNE